VQVQVSQGLRAFDGHELVLEDAWCGEAHPLRVDALVAVTSRLPEDTLYHGLQSREADWAAAGLASVARIGDAEAPGLIAHAVYAGHRYARALGEPVAGDVPFRRHFHHGTGA
jgi:dimethylamine/trimethylamine dehydrogenase